MSATTWEQINRKLLAQAAAEENGYARRSIENTLVEKNIHVPSDSSLLFDIVRVLTRLLAATKSPPGRVPDFRVTSIGPNAGCWPFSMLAGPKSEKASIWTCSRLPETPSATAAEPSSVSSSRASMSAFSQSPQSGGNYADLADGWSVIAIAG